MTPRQRLQILLLAISGALSGFGFIWLATYSERDETICRNCNQRDFMVKVRTVPIRVLGWVQIADDGKPFADPQGTQGTIDNYCRYCKTGWHSDSPPKRKRK